MWEADEQIQSEMLTEAQKLQLISAGISVITRVSRPERDTVMKR